MHIKSQKHLRGKAKLAKKNQCELTIIKALKKFDRDHYPMEETLPDSTHIYVVTAMLKASVALDSFYLKSMVILYLAGLIFDNWCPSFFKK